MGDPLTPEEQYDESKERHSNFHREYAQSECHEWRDVVSPVMWMVITLNEQTTALRDIIASLDAEMARQSVTINGLERRIETLETELT